MVLGTELDPGKGNSPNERWCKRRLVADTDHASNLSMEAYAGIHFCFRSCSSPVVAGICRCSDAFQECSQAAGRRYLATMAIPRPCKRSLGLIDDDLGKEQPLDNRSFRQPGYVHMEGSGMMGQDRVSSVGMYRRTALCAQPSQREEEDYYMHRLQNL